MRISLLEEIRQVVPFEAHAWLVTDPETEVGASPLADVPCLPELPRLIKLKYLTEVNRWTDIPGGVALLSSSTEGRPERSRVWRELLREYDVVDVASMVFRDRFGCWAWLDLWRTKPRGPFSAADAELLAATAPAITEGLRRATAATFCIDPSPSPAQGPVVLMLTPELEVKGQTADTDGYLRLLVPTDDARPPVPAAAYNVGAQLAALEAGIDEHPATARVHLANGIWLTLRAARIADGSAPSSGDIAVTIERSSPGERLRVFALASGLTPREIELLQHLATGAATREVAQRMFVSDNTVQDHLKSIFTKTGARARSSLLAIATGIKSEVASRR